MNDKQVCGECKLFTNEDSFGNGWCEFHQKEAFCENVACEDVIEIEGDNSHNTGNNNQWKLKKKEKYNWRNSRISN